MVTYTHKMDVVRVDSSTSRRSTIMVSGVKQDGRLTLAGLTLTTLSDT